MSTGAIRYVTGTKKNPLGLVYLQCHVKPGASKSREGVTALTDEAVEVCIAAQAQDGEANKATLALLSKVLGRPKSDLRIARGMKSRDKTIVVEGMSPESSPEDLVDAVQALLLQAAESTK